MLKITREGEIMLTSKPRQKQVPAVDIQFSSKIFSY